MKKAIPVIAAFTIMFSACKKNNDDGGGSGPGGQLLPVSTGWKMVSSVTYAAAVSGYPGGNSMTPYDLTMVGNEMALLYSDNYTMWGGTSHIIMKLMLTSGTNDPKNKSVKLNYDRGGNAAQIHRFIPGSFNTISGKFFNNEILVYDENGGPNAGQNFGSINALPTLRWYADGTILAGLMDGPYSSAYWAWRYPATGNFNYVVNAWTGDSVRNVASSPFKLNDGAIYDMTFSQKNGAMYFSVLKNLNPAQPGTAPNYQMICRNIVPDMDGNKNYAVVTSDVQGDATMIMLTEVEYRNRSAVFTRLLTYRWRKGSNTLEKVYSVENLSLDLGKRIMELTTNTSFPNEVRLTPDGTAYFLYTYSPMQNGGTGYTALVLVNKDGIKETGKLIVDEMNAVKRGQFGLSCCRYFNGAYYAVVHPMDEYDYDKYKPEFRIEVVKLVP